MKHATLRTPDATAARRKEALAVSRPVPSGYGSKLAISLWLAVVLAGCVARSALPVTATEAATPAPTSTRESIEADMAGRLVSRRTRSPPEIDGQIEDAWTAAEPLRVPLTWGWGGTEHALDVELRALHTTEAVSFLAQWPGEPPRGEENTVFNRFTFHWRIPEPAAQKLDCNVVCHTAFADGNGRMVYANAETIPQGGSAALAAAGGWHAGIWTLEWSRPLSSGNPFDLQFDDLDRGYSFLVKVFKGVEGRPDPVSARHLLVFQP